MRFNRETFFDGYRAAFGPLRQKQVDGLSFLLDKLEDDDFSLPQASYVLATVDHESAHTFQPIKEIRERKTSPRRANQDRYWLDNFYGRGFVQITWRKNYEKFGIADDPDKALEPETAYNILSVGMKEGMFTGKKISDYINSDHTNFVDARKVVNGLDRADLIAGRARKFQNILEASEMSEERHHASKPVVHVNPEMDDKGVTTSPDKPMSESEGTPPPAPAVEIKASEVPWVTKVSSLSIPAGVLSILAAIGKFVGGLPPYVWVAFAGIGITAMYIGFQIWREKSRQAHERTLKLMDAGKAPDQNNLRLV